MKKCGFICLAIAMSMLVSSNCFAAEKNVDDMVVDSQFSLTGGESGAEVEELSNGRFIPASNESKSCWHDLDDCREGRIPRSLGRFKFDAPLLAAGYLTDSIKSFHQYMDTAANPVVEISGTMDGEDETKFYWSDDNYTYNGRICKSVAIMQADSSAVWSDESGIIFKIGDVASEVDGLRVNMGASADGPRDIELEYSTDGETYLPLNTSGKNIYSLSKADTIENLVEVDLRGIQRNSHIAVCKDKKADYTWSLMVCEPIYIRATVASDYRMDGKTGLYGAECGELAIHTVELLYVNDNEVAKVPETPSVQAYKIGNRAASISWNCNELADGYEVYVKKGNRKYKKQKVIAGAKNTKYKLKGLSPKGVYRIKMRSYVLDGNEKIYSPYSKVVVANMSKQPLPKDLKTDKKHVLRVRKTKRVKVWCTGGKNTGYIDSIQYKVKNPKIAAVKNGVIKAKKAGKTTLTVNVKLKNGLSKKLTSKIIVRK